MYRSLVVVLAVSLAWSSSRDASAADRLVPSQYPTIQAAITACQAGDVVLVASGPYAESINFLGKSITVKGVDGSANTYLSAPSAGSSFVTFTTNESAAAVLEGFTILNSLNTPAMRITSASPTIRSCTFQNCQNTGSQGGALYVSGTNPSPSFNGCQFLGNRAANGGAVALLAGLTSFVNCDFQSNEAMAGNSQGGAVYSAAGRMSIVDSRFTNNTTRTGNSQGGAIFISNAPSSFVRCVFSDNTTTSDSGYGGAIREDVSASSYTDCDFIRCTSTTVTCCAASYGGALFFGSGARPTITGCDFVQCKALPASRPSYGGAVFYEGGCGGTMSGCTIDSSTCTTEGGAIYVAPGANPIIRDTIIRNCSADSGGAAFVSAGSTPFFLRTSFIDCTAPSAGGGLDIRDNSNIVIDDCRFVRCTSTGQGGGIRTWYAAVSIRNCIFQSNTSASGSAIRANGDTNRWPTLLSNNGCGNSGVQSNWIVGTWFDAPPYNTNAFIQSCGRDCNSNGIADDQEIVANPALDCNGNGVLDSCDLQSGSLPDCNSNGVVDSCEIATGAAHDCNGNGIPDTCDIAGGGIADCNANGVPDSCDLGSGGLADCNADGIPDTCQPDCNGNGVTDVCEIASGSAIDCNGNGVPDSCDLAGGRATDRNNDGILDSCQVLDFTGLVAELKPIVGTINGLPSTGVCWRVYATFSTPGASVSAIFGDSADPISFSATGGFFQSPSGSFLGSQNPCSSADGSLAYDSFLTLGGDCAATSGALAQGMNFTAFETTGGAIGFDSATGGIVYQIPGAQTDANGRVLLMQLTTKSGVKPNAIFNLLGDNAGAGKDNEWFAFGLSIPNPVLVDCNGNGTHDAIDIASGLSRDCDRSGVPDSCEYAAAIANADCDGDGAFDLCEIYSGTEQDANNNNIVDDCECLGDVDGNGAVNVDDLIEIIAAWGDPNPGAADLDGDGTVGGGDLALVLQGWGSCL
jgi:hypothetical protein